MSTEFDEKASSWDDDPKRVRRAEIIGEFLKSRIKLEAIDQALEYGSGTGLLSFSMQDDLKRVVLMDESGEMTRIANEKAKRLSAPHFKAIQYDLMKDPLPEDHYDLIYILLTLHHVGDYQGLVKKFAQLLNPGGYLAIIDLEKEDGSFHEGEFHGHKGFEKPVLETVILESGLRVVSYEVCYELEKTDEHGNTRTYPLFMSIAVKPE